MIVLPELRERESKKLQHSARLLEQILKVRDLHGIRLEQWVNLFDDQMFEGGTEDNPEFYYDLPDEEDDSEWEDDEDESDEEDGDQ